jgi:hypothetical protein
VHEASRAEPIFANNVDRLTSKCARINHKQIGLVWLIRGHFGGHQHWHKTLQNGGEADLLGFEQKGT